MSGFFANLDPNATAYKIYTDSDQYWQYLAIHWISFESFTSPKIDTMYPSQKKLDWKTIPFLLGADPFFGRETSCKNVQKSDSAPKKQPEQPQAMIAIGVYSTTGLCT